ncbi:hypothetical protein WDU94_012182 [Cyamophila willieti]
MFNRRGFKSKTKTKDSKLQELMFADDCALVAETPEKLQILVNAFARAADDLGLKVSVEKTEVMFVNCPTSNITLNGNTLKETPVFKYLGSLISNTGNINFEIENRINAASRAFGKLYPRVWKPHELTLKTKLLVHKTVVLSTLLYSSECWTTLEKHTKKLNAFHMRCLRSILKVSWKDYVPSEKILEKSGMLSMGEIMRTRRLRWLGHISRMEESRLPYKIAFAE